MSILSAAFCQDPIILFDVLALLATLGFLIRNAAETWRLSTLPETVQGSPCSSEAAGLFNVGQSISTYRLLPSGPSVATSGR